MRTQEGPVTTQRFYDALADDYIQIFEDWERSVQTQGRMLDEILPLGPVLDVAAGVGTQAIGLALRGREVVARDLSPRLVDRGRKEAHRLGAPVDYDVGDMRERQDADKGRYTAVICFDNTLPHLLGDDDVLAALEAAYAALVPGGMYAASIRDYDALALARPAMDPQPRLFGRSPDRRIVSQVWTWDDDGATYSLTHLMQFEAEGWATRARTARYRALRRADLYRLATAAGFVEPQWLPPEQTGFYQPIFTVLR
jgi:glycine/sarcosine N-methyltransferase